MDDSQRRREFLQSAFALAVPLQRENARPGTNDWQLSKVRTNKGKGYRTSLIEGYCSHQSIEAGQTLRIFLSAEPSRRATVDIYRMGYYGGAGGRHTTQLGPVSVKPQPEPPLTKS